MPQIIPTAQRALQVFEVFARENRPLSNSELARYLDLADSSCSDLLYTLRQAGFLLRTPKSRQFIPTGKLIDIARVIANSNPMQMFASEALEILSRESGETSMCGHLDGDKVKIFACHESPRALRYVLRAGTLVEVHWSSLGKALLGGMSTNEREAMIDSLPMEPVTPHTIVDKDALRADIEASMVRQWFITENEGSEHVSAIAISGYVDNRLTALSIVSPTRRAKRELENHVKILLKAKAEFFGP